MSVNFDFQVDTQARDEFAPVPAGNYVAMVQGVEDCTTKAGTGRYLKIKFLIQGPSQAGRIVFMNLNYQNPNETAEKIGRQQLGQLAGALGLQALQNSDQLVNKSCEIRVTIRKSEEYGDSNDVKGFKPLASAAAAPQAPQPAQYAQPAPAQYHQAAPLPPANVHSQAAPLPPLSGPGVGVPPQAQPVAPLQTGQAQPPWVHQG